MIDENHETSERWEGVAAFELIARFTDLIQFSSFLAVVTPLAIGTRKRVPLEASPETECFYLEELEYGGQSIEI